MLTVLRRWALWPHALVSDGALGVFLANYVDQLPKL